MRVETVARDGEFGDRFGGADLPLGGARLTLLVDARRHHGGTELGGEREESVEARARFVALFEVDRVQQGLTPQPGEGRSSHGGFGGVDHDGHRGLSGESAHDLVHVGDAVRAGVVDAHVQDVCALFDLFASDLHAGVPVALEHGGAESLRSVRVRPLTDEQHRAVLLVVDGRVDRGDRVLGGGGPLGRGEWPHRLDDSSQVLGRRPAAPAHHLHAVFGDEAREVLGQRVGRQIVVHLALDDARETGVRHAGQGQHGAVRERAQRLVHLHGSGRAVKTDDVDAERRERGDGRPDLGTGQHPSGEFDGDLHLDGHDAAVSSHGSMTGGDRGLAREEVEHRLDQQEVHATF